MGNSDMGAVTRKNNYITHAYLLIFVWNHPKLIPGLEGGVHAGTVVIVFLYFDFFTIPSPARSLPRTCRAS